MAIKCGSRGDETKRLQLLLKKLGFYEGAVDGDFGPGTDAAVKKFQGAHGLDADGVAGPAMMVEIERLVFLAESKVPAASADTALIDRCLRLTATFETNAEAPLCFAGVAGNGDGMVLSFGALQWNFGKKTLQPLFLDLFSGQPELMDRIFGADAAVFQALLWGPHNELMAYFAQMQVEDKPL